MVKSPKREVVVNVDCDFCPENAEYDFKTKLGPWAYGCAKHYQKYRSEGSVLFTKLKRSQ